ncbi:MAG TPA: RNA methyltransferase, partial [Alistipes sp.]|nr:RNA methyltransferase [Alistipes sp.]
ASTAECVRQLRDEGYEVLAVEQVEGAAMLDAFCPEPGRRYALVFGNEVEGVAQEVVDLCHGALEIPQFGVKHSINVAVSGGVVLWRFFEKLKN